MTAELEAARRTSKSRVNEVSGQVVDSAMRVHSTLGPGLLESAYHVCLVHELRKRGLDVRAQLQLPVFYDGLKIAKGYRVDLLVEGVVIVEIKAVAGLHKVHEAQVLSYLKLSACRVGLLINFHEVHLRDGIKRLVNDL